jgi:hypothetical protein
MNPCAQVRTTYLELSVKLEVKLDSGAGETMETKFRFKPKNH